MRPKRVFLENNEFKVEMDDGKIVLCGDNIIEMIIFLYGEDFSNGFSMDYDKILLDYHKKTFRELKI